MPYIDVFTTETIAIIISAIVVVVTFLRNRGDFLKAKEDSRDSFISSLQERIKILGSRVEYLEQKYEVNLELQKKYYLLLNERALGMEYIATVEMFIHDFCKCDKTFPKPQVPYIFYDEIKDMINEKRSRNSQT